MKAKESLIGIMENNIQGNGKMGNKMVLAFIKILKEKNEKDYGKMGKECIGLNDNLILFSGFLVYFLVCS